jgi:erythrin-vacuolar iron transport family protein
MIPGISTRRRFADLSEQEVLALAISSEEDDGRIYRSYAQMLRADYPASAAVFDGMALEEDGHRQRLIDLHQARFGDVIPLIRREHVAGFYARKPVWLNETLGLAAIRAEASGMEQQAAKFYEQAAARATDAATRKLLAGVQTFANRYARRRGCRRAPSVHFDVGAAGAWRVDGRICLYPCADLCHGFCHTGYLDNISGGHCRIGWGGHLDGLHRSRA